MTNSLCCARSFQQEGAAGLWKTWEMWDVLGVTKALLFQIDVYMV